MTVYYLLPPNGEGEPTGPHTPEALGALRDSGAVSDQHLVAHEGASEWTTVAATFGPLPRIAAAPELNKPAPPITIAAPAAPAHAGETPISPKAPARKRWLLGASVGVAAAALVAAGIAISRKNTPPAAEPSAIAASPSGATQEATLPAPPEDESWKTCDARPLPEQSMWKAYSTAPEDAPYPDRTWRVEEYQDDKGNACLRLKHKKLSPLAPCSVYSIGGSHPCLDAKPGPLSTQMGSELIYCGGVPTCKLIGIFEASNDPQKPFVTWAVDNEGKPWKYEDNGKVMEIISDLKNQCKTKRTPSIKCVFEKLTECSTTTIGYISKSTNEHIDAYRSYSTPSLTIIEYQKSEAKTIGPGDLALCILAGPKLKQDLELKEGASVTINGGKSTVIHISKNTHGSHNGRNLGGETVYELRGDAPHGTKQYALIATPYGSSIDRQFPWDLLEVEITPQKTTQTVEVFSSSARVRLKLPPLPSDSPAPPVADPLDKPLSAQAQKLPLPKILNQFCQLKLPKETPENFTKPTAAEFPNAHTVRELLHEVLRRNPGWQVATNREKRTITFSRN